MNNSTKAIVMDIAPPSLTDAWPRVGTPSVWNPTTQRHEVHTTSATLEESDSMIETTPPGPPRSKLTVTLRYENSLTSTTETVIDIFGLSRSELLEHLVNFIRVCGYYVGDDELLDFYRE